MKTYLFPHKCKAIGLVVFVTGLLFSLIFNNYFDGFWEVSPYWVINSFPGGKVDLTLTISCSLMIVGGLLACFSKEKIEDEFIANLRLNSLLWAVFINYLLLLIGVVIVYGLDFLYILLYNIFTPMIIFLVRFNFLLFKNSRLRSYEK